MYKVVLFDLDNTLLDYDRSERDAMRRATLQHELYAEEEEWLAFRNVFAPINFTYWMERVERKLLIGDVLELSFGDTFDRLGGDRRLARAVADTYWQLFSRTCHLLDGAPELLAGLQGSYRLGAVSNGIGEAQRSRLETGGLDRYFEQLFISDEVGFYKPQPEIFGHALRMLGVERHEALFVGDSLQDDYAGAAGAGIDFCLYNPLGKPLEPHIRPAYTIGALAELHRILGGGAAHDRIAGVAIDG
ncbi:YjjG family noncanonical pyrimidine nucleotidase [Paenibacillus humicola]|uniref:YjjG family noncanonical pyrimidine nucleotidase n=1 Tax=Paenibacillus humicola TaxID=3110540 RepID=UPI00237BE0C0|nr:YjjG family noncanonical pyrimidine nucleotidase [Paenibacillus humicola]